MLWVLPLALAVDNATIPDPPAFVTAYDPSLGCHCDPTTHFSHFTVCELTTGPNAHVTVTHTHHKRCHPLSADYFECIEVRVVCFSSPITVCYSEQLGCFGAIEMRY